MAVQAEGKFKLKEPKFTAEETVYVTNLSFVMDFPRELKRNWFEQLDFRFLAILLLTSVLHISLLVFFISYFKNFERTNDAQKIQKQYAHLLLKDFTVEDFSSLERKRAAKPEQLTLPDLTDKDVSDVYADEKPDVSTTEINVKKSNLPDDYVQREIKISENRQQSLAGKNSEASEYKFTSALAREVSQRGILYFISNDNNSETDENLAKIISNSQKNEKFLNSSMGDVSLTKHDEFFTRTENAGFYNTLKGSKTVVSYNAELSSLTPLTKVEAVSAIKNIELDYQAISKIAKNQKNRTSRTAAHVTQVLMSHNKSIQDCYKQITKKFPYAKGNVVVRISVTPAGSVERVQIMDSSIQNDQMLRCMVNRIRRWKDFGVCDPELGTVSYKQTYVFGF